MWLFFLFPIDCRGSLSPITIGLPCFSSPLHGLEAPVDKGLGMSPNITNTILRPFCGGDEEIDGRSRVLPLC